MYATHGILIVVVVLTRWRRQRLRASRDRRLDLLGPAPARSAVRDGITADFGHLAVVLEGITQPCARFATGSTRNFGHRIEGLLASRLPDRDFDEVHHSRAQGYASCARRSPDGRYGATMTFVSGDIPARRSSTSAGSSCLTLTLTVRTSGRRYVIATDDVITACDAGAAARSTFVCGDVCSRRYASRFAGRHLHHRPGRADHAAPRRARSRHDGGPSGRPRTSTTRPSGLRQHACAVLPTIAEAGASRQLDAGRASPATR